MPVRPIIIIRTHPPVIQRCSEAGLQLLACGVPSLHGALPSVVPPAHAADPSCHAHSSPPSALSLLVPAGTCVRTHTRTRASRCFARVCVALRSPLILAPQFVAKRCTAHGAIRSGDLAGVQVGQKDMTQGAFAVWQDLLQKKVKGNQEKERGCYDPAT